MYAMLCVQARAEGGEGQTGAGWLGYASHDPVGTSRRAAVLWIMQWGGRGLATPSVCRLCTTLHYPALRVHVLDGLGERGEAAHRLQISLAT